MAASNYFKDMQKRLTEQHLQKAILASALTVNADMSERIFVDGKAADHSQIGEYNTTDPLYVNPKMAPKKFPTKGKPIDGKAGKTKFANGEPHKTGYFDSYASFRKKVGRKTNKVNLVLFGVLQSDFSKGPKPTERGAVVTLNGLNALKAEGQEDHFNKVIFKHTKEELKKYYSLVKQQFRLYAK